MSKSKVGDLFGHLRVVPLALHAHEFLAAFLLGAVEKLRKFGTVLHSTVLFVNAINQSNFDAINQ